MLPLLSPALSLPSLPITPSLPSSLALSSLPGQTKADHAVVMWIDLFSVSAVFWGRKTSGICERAVKCHGQ